MNSAGNAIRATWTPPALPNGQIMLYKLKYSYKDVYGYRQADTVISSDQSHELQGLMFNQDYEIEVTACTRLENVDVDVCGLDWAKTALRTAIGSKTNA